MSTGLRAGTNNDGYLQVNGTDVLTALSSGNVGIGTSTPNTYNNYSTLTLNGTNGGELDFEINGTLSADIFANHTGLRLQTRTALPIVLSTHNGSNLIEQLRITTDAKVRVPDNGKFTAGAGDDLQIYHDGSNSFMLNSTGELQISSGGSTLFIQAVTNENAVKVIPNAAVELYHDGSKKFETTATGVTVTGSLTQTTEYPTIRPVLDLNFAATKTLDRRITFTRDSLGTFTDDMGIVRYASNNVPRFDHDPTTGESLGLLIEESRTNLVEYGDFTTGWIEFGGTATSTTATTAPDGTFTAKKITSKGDVATAGLYDSINYQSNTTYTHTMWLKAGTITIAGITVNSGGKWASSNYPYITVNLSTGAVTASGGVSAKATAYPNGWYRLEATGTFAGNTTTDAIWVHSQSGDMSGNNTSYYYVWGPQAEQGAFATSYIPTTGTTATRAQDIAKITGTNFTDFYNQQEGTLVCDQSVSNLGTANQYSVILSSDVNESIGMGYRVGGGGSGNYGFYIIKSGDALFRNVTANITANTPYKTALAYELNNGGTCFNGETSVTDTSLSLPTPDRMLIGEGYSANNEMTKGHIRKISYYNKRLPNAQLQGLTQQ